MNISPNILVRDLMMTVLSIFTLGITPSPSKHIIPDSIKEEAEIALSYYPELEDAVIEFGFKKDIKKSTMLARPKVSSFFKRRKYRAYEILISEKFKISGQVFKTVDMPKEVMIGWLGHELGHIMDYQDRNRMNIIAFGIRYLFFDKYIAKAERTADSFAVESGMEKYILATKEFILNRSDLDQKYVSRIKKYYLSPAEIMDLIRERDSVLEDRL